MKNRLLFAALSFAIVLVVGLVLYLRGREGVTDTAAALEGSGVASSGGEHSSLETPATDARRGDAEGERVTERVDALLAEGGRLVTGRVVLPAGVPADEHIEVVMMIRAREQGWPPEYAGPSEVVVARSTPDATGAFGLPLPDGLEYPWLLLEACYVYLAEPFDLEDLDLPVLLEPRLGGALRFRFRPPPETRLDPQALVGREVLLECDHMSYRNLGYEPEDRTLALDEDLEAIAGGLPPGNLSSLRGSLAPYVFYERVELGVAAGEIWTLEIPLIDGNTIAGRVIGEDGRGIPRADVYTYTTIGPEETTFSADVETGEDGTFRLEGLHPGPTELHARKEGYLTVDVSEAEIGFREGNGPTEVLDLEIVLSLGRSIEGNVRLADGRPVRETEVLATPSSRREGSPSPEADVRTDEQGRFLLTGLEEGPYDVHVHTRLDEMVGDDGKEIVFGWGHSREFGWTAEQLDVPGGARGIELVLQPPPGLEGIVVDESGAPVTRFEVLVIRDRGQPLADPERLDPDLSMQFTSEDGTFRCEDVIAGAWVVLVRTDDSRSSPPRRVVLPGDAEPLRFVLPCFPVVSGVVVDPEGRPVAYAEVNAFSDSRPKSWWEKESRDLTSSEGVFHFDDLPPGRFVLSARTEGFASSEPVRVDSTSDDGNRPVILRLTRGGYLDVEVLDEEGKPAYAYVEVRKNAADPWWNNGETDENGRVELGPLAAGERSLVAGLRGHDGRGLQGRATVVEGETRRVTLRPTEPSTLLVRGIVTSGGEPVAGGWVSGVPGGDWNRSSRADCGVDGRFELLLEAGGWTVFHVHGGGRGRTTRFEEELPARGEAELAFDLPSGGMCGRLVREDGGPPPRCEVLVERRRGGSQAWAGPDLVRVYPWKNGDWRCENLPPGQYRVSAVVDRTGRFDRDYEPFALREQRDVVVQEGRITEGVDLVLVRGGTVEGRVLDPHDRRVGQAVVYALDADGSPLFRRGRAVALEGWYSLGDLPPGLVFLEVAGDGLATPEPQAVLVETGRVVEQDLRLVAATLLTIRLEGVDAGETDVVLGLRDAAGREHVRPREAYLDPREDLSRDFGPLPPGEWHAEARLPDGRTVKEDFTLTGEKERTILLELSK